MVVFYYIIFFLNIVILFLFFAFLYEMLLIDNIFYVFSNIL